MADPAAADRKIDKDATVSLGKGHFIAEHESQSVIMSISAGKFFAFDAIGDAIWNKLKQPVRVDALIGDLATRYDAPADVIERDVLKFLTTLDENGLIVVQRP